MVQGRDCTQGSGVLEGEAVGTELSLRMWQVRGQKILVTAYKRKV
jgi:hypothetical protein